ncbi:hypothetical protein DM860_016425 [Cuscuta australis]|uniref:Uncharacterized protein n=1 Tax=Cuscuta australis TaxID=267555 RepID=A0A328DIQ1_9ASTE|nr:hypothetical protein DM860_016425 [Cuscuta australis]
MGGGTVKMMVAAVGKRPKSTHSCKQNSDCYQVCGFDCLSPKCYGDRFVRNNVVVVVAAAAAVTELCYKCRA